MRIKILIYFLLHAIVGFAQNSVIADLGNGYYKNPVIPGRYGDPSICRVGGDYFMTHSGIGSPSLLIWHSKDLVNWEPLDFAVKDFFESAWAPDLVFYEGKFYLYVTMVSTISGGGRSFDNYVIVANKAGGPWSKPVNLNVKGYIDPGHVAGSNGKRYLYFDKGNAIELSADGTKTVGDMKKVYDGWKYPEDWTVECFCLEGPKFFRRGEYYYLVSAQGGTTGPSTSHMAVVARSKSPLGPWVNSPINPLIHTKNRSEKWWSQGHASLIQAQDSSWWAIFHAYENGFKTLGRPTLLVPVEWTNDGWPIILESAGNILKKPKGEALHTGMNLSDKFDHKKMGLQWRSSIGNPDSLFLIQNNSLIGKAVGVSISNANRLFCIPQDHAYEISIEVKSQSAEVGIGLYANENQYVGISLKNNSIHAYGGGAARKPEYKIKESSVFLKIRNLNHDISLYFSMDGNTWTQYPNGYEISSFGNTYPTLFGIGEGEIIFKNFKYKSLKN